MDNHNYLKTLALNVLFVMLLPLVLAAFTKSLSAMVVYLLFYSAAEMAIDLQRNLKRVNISRKAFYTLYTVTVIANATLLYGVSTIIQEFQPSVLRILLASLVWLAAASYFETKVDKKILELV